MVQLGVVWVVVLQAVEVIQYLLKTLMTLPLDYTITSGKNAMSVGPITVEAGVVVTIPSGSRWVIL
jgi:hypothetical protein